MFIHHMFSHTSILIAVLGTGMNTGTGITGGEVAAEVVVGMTGEEKEIIIVEAGVTVEALIIAKTVGGGCI